MYICEWRTPPPLLSCSLCGVKIDLFIFVRASPNSPAIDLSGRVREAASTNWGSYGSERVSAATGRVPFPSIILFLVIHKQLYALPAHYIFQQKQP